MLLTIKFPVSDAGQRILPELLLSILIQGSDTVQNFRAILRERLFALEERLGGPRLRLQMELWASEESLVQTRLLRKSACSRIHH